MSLNIKLSELLSSINHSQKTYLDSVKIYLKIENKNSNITIFNLKIKILIFFILRNRLRYRLRKIPIIYVFFY